MPNPSQAQIAAWLAASPGANSSGGFDATHPQQRGSGSGLAALGLYGITPTQDQQDYVNGTGYWASDEFKNLPADQQTAKENAASQSLMPTMQQRLAIMGPQPSGGNDADPAAMEAWLMKDPSIAAAVKAGNGNAFQVAPALGIIPSGWYQKGNGILPNHSGRNAAIMAATMLGTAGAGAFLAPAADAAMGAETGSLAATGINAGINAGVGAGIGAAGGESGSQIALGAAAGAGGALAGSEASSLAGGGALGGLAALGASQAARYGINALLPSNPTNSTGTLPAGTGSGAVGTAGNPMTDTSGAGSSGGVDANTVSNISSLLSSGAAGAAGGQNNQNTQNDKYNQVLVALFNAELAQRKQNNDIAVSNPARFAGQSAQASQLLAPSTAPTSFINPRTGAVTQNLSANYVKPLNDTAKAAETELQRQNISNLMASPTANPVPTASSVVAPTLTAPTGSTLANILGAAGMGTSAIAALMKSYPSIAKAFGGSGGSGTPSTSQPGTDNAVDPMTGEAYNNNNSAQTNIYGDYPPVGTPDTGAGLGDYTDPYADY
jgi:hypothetical protein